jgi:tetratricopeptide (TPR) repeat protein
MEKKKRDKDLSQQLRFVMAFLLIFFSLQLIQLFTVRLMPWTVQLALSLVGAGVTVLLANKIGDFFGRSLYGQKRAAFSLREQLAGELEKVRYHKREKNFVRALDLVNAILKQDQEFPEALFLKAQILHQGFGNMDSARGYLEKVMELTSPEESIHNWAKSYSEGVDQI